jgi:hypothetical protein
LTASLLRVDDRIQTVVVDDASPEPEITRLLDQLAGRESDHPVAQTSRISGSCAAKRGMTLHADRDVVLLNSDTEVAGDWLDRIRRCVHAEDDIGTATPFSNNATICSYPSTAGRGVPGTLGLAASIASSRPPTRENASTCRLAWAPASISAAPASIRSEHSMPSALAADMARRTISAFARSPQLAQRACGRRFCLSRRRGQLCGRAPGQGKFRAGGVAQGPS